MMLFLKSFIHKTKEESGQAMVIFAIAFVVLGAFSAFTVDLGKAYHEKSQLQSAADAAALAGAMDLPNAGGATTTALYYAEQNGVPSSEITINTPYNGDSGKIEVICTETFRYSFARLIGFDEKELTVRAVAENDSQWSGEALPFVNLDDDYGTTSEIVAWEKVSPGDFESINNYEIENSDDPDTLYFTIDYLNGIEVKDGTVATIKQEVGYVYDQHYPDKLVYVLSLSSDVMNSGKVLLTDGSYRSLSKMKNKDRIDPSQLVLLECIFHDYDYSGKTLFLTVLQAYDIMNGEFPPDYVNPDGSSSKLIE